MELPRATSTRIEGIEHHERDCEEQDDACYGQPNIRLQWQKETIKIVARSLLPHEDPHERLPQ
jgi:hypothetical protein